jgi:hypothetical protein
VAGVALAAALIATSVLGWMVHLLTLSLDYRAAGRPTSVCRFSPLF